ncbi:elongation factor P hydroxylase [Vibrio ostreicida]|uniref:Elongation factor P hydroxylase n=1 Tax=Vibrio ostreicida TaxID=526588 RepID=A0ABT8BUG5_9VIBR|nr:elongation factor P hydroxylase [Vibrio ostreicida]MDN3610651.1 elongation factor P hydroxylase [Vibrio ostreicida]NPD07351.1 elongation factor P hydroxylase [Vibrio ostreicida]
MNHHYKDLITIFNVTFLAEYNTRLERGGQEPIYLPANELAMNHRIFFANGFYASALHEIAHWCVAGPERRLLEDFGYWYEADGRTRDRQAEFEKVEVRPQAYEWIFSLSAGFAFSVSCDNLNGDFEPDRFAFMKKVHREVEGLFEQGFPDRVLRFSQALRAFYRTPKLTFSMFEVE